MAERTPIFAIIAGESGVGKSTDQLLAFPTAWFLCLKGAEKPGAQFGIDVVSVVVSELAHVTQVLQHVKTLPQKQKPPALLIDDITLLAEKTHDRLKPLYPKSKTFDFWDALKGELRDVRDEGRIADCEVLASSHLAKPDTDMNGQFHKGGPTMPGKKMRTAIPHIADEVYIGELEPGREPWPGVYRCEPDPEWHMKTRIGALRGRAPMNIRELWRLKGYACPRIPGLEWQEDVTEMVAQKILEGNPWIDIWNRAEAQLLAKGLHPGHIFWALRDGVDRATLAKRRTLLGRFQPSNEPTTTKAAPLLVPGV
jgi:hypothetical protein